MAREQEPAPLVRQQGCEAIFSPDDQLLPVCMGGTALAGCNRASFCLLLHTEQTFDPNAAMIDVATVSNDDRVLWVTSVPSRPLLQPPPQPEA
jgi:hypothetical protein